ncbi:hypothetical protein [Streptomyces sp. RKAG293]|uniref:hypothetical protein n=1 Tax=Streptomyces sp. RKAG293 TaxID=2893403 RepID=UPI0020335AF0|nr:hypothetical protein [Streptomyces sp. RKAG293]MCM2417737.1 hypothetical protein [Streptomyces sp. RKAG293]
MALLVTLAITTDGLSRVVAGFGGLVAVVVAVLGLFAPLRMPSVPQQAVTWSVVAILCLDLLTSAMWPLWAYHQANTDKNVTAEASLTGNRGVLPGGSATFHSPVTVSRKTIAVTIEAVDTDGAQGNCSPETGLSLLNASAAGPATPITTVPGEPARIRLLPNQRQITLTVRVENPRDPNCAVDLSLSKVTLSN